MRTVKIEEIRIDGGTQGRVVINQQKVYEYRDAMKEGDVFPLMETVFDGSTYWLVDGFHRYHAINMLGLKKIEINYKPGTLEDAQVMSFGMNARHGLPRSNEDKRKIVQDAIVHPLLKDKSNYEIAKACVVSQPFVASIRNPEAKAKQEEQRKKHVQKKAEKISQDTNQISTNQISNQNGEHPDDDEMKAAELAMQADVEAMHRILEDDEPLKVAHEEIKRLNHLNAQLEIRIRGLINEKTEAIKEVKKLQKQLEKMKEK